MQAQKCHFRSRRDERGRRPGEGAGGVVVDGWLERPWNNCLNHDRKMTTAWRGLCVCACVCVCLFMIFSSRVACDMTHTSSSRNSKTKSTCSCDNSQTHDKVCVSSAL